ncbi:hypothetical protein GCM10007049_37760 [Echinicola pacifica]|uniref:WG containing repeat-containing protein n=1 Tax=Echinicola pacifica TaxID=346377 RepID=A0A918QEP6_9BACT|nr:WG repeat-containing protein [Echinicola pacifica]GGZ40882.1 hypothetical protein GCM10007049_37760 [Echinicola pacifica]
MSKVLGQWISASMLILAFTGTASAQMYEVYDSELNLIQRINDDHIFLLSESIRVSDKDARLQLLGNNYKPFLELEGEAIYQYLSPWILVEQDGKLGAYHEYGEQIFKPEYDAIDMRYNELLANKGNAYHLYDVGTKIHSFLGQYEAAHIASNGQVIAKIPAGYLLPISEDPNHLYLDLQSTSPKAILAQEAEGYGLINRHGQYILEPVLDSLRHLEGEFYFGYNENQYMLIEAREETAEIRYSSYHKITEKEGLILEYIHGRLRRVMEKDGILLDMMGMQQVVKVDPTHYNVYFKDRKVGLLDHSGNWQVSPSDSIEVIYAGNENRYAATTGQQYGYVDKGGKWIIKAQFQEASPFSEGLAAIRNNSGWGYIDLYGKSIIFPEFESAGQFQRGLAVIRSSGKANLIDPQGRKLLAEGYDDIFRSDDSYFITENNGLFGILDPLGNEITPPIFQSLRRESFNQIVVQRNDRYGIMDEQGEVILPIYYLDILVDKEARKILAEDLYTPPISEEDGKGKKKKKTK